MMNKREDFIKTMDDYLSLVDEFVFKNAYTTYMNEQKEESYVKGYDCGIIKGIKLGVLQASQYRQDIINKEIEKIKDEAIKNLSKNMNIDYIKAMDLLNIFKDEYDKYLELIKE